jgi:hypothetical protein
MKSIYIALSIAALIISSCRKTSVEGLGAHDRTIKTIRNCRIDLVDWPRQPLGDRLELIEREAAKVGVVVKVSEALRGQMKERAWVYPELRIREISLAEAIKFTIDCTVLRYRITDDGALLFFWAGEDSSVPVDRDTNSESIGDPFAK